MPEAEEIAATLAASVVQGRAARGTMPDEKEAVRVYFTVLAELRAQLPGGQRRDPTRTP